MIFQKGYKILFPTIHNQKQKSQQWNQLSKL